ncbi:hypothetical protein AQS8620_00988 [Aquimixticola soesokkakensis]|uniref:Heme-binding protein n=1 Tax=Aquimixticola soesokkakensis TaxID=1519096 RepID=A0A1Y5S296_9RHOB|nr:heme-binding protein [Aquimixticola soesokkakensis]SLN31005.1 hypothetical protein AQS8620_00988 [Aquimixticola soesokkakensis]
MTDISLTVAQAIVAHSIAYGAERGWNPLSTVVVDAGGHAIAFARGDLAPPGRLELAIGKAKMAVMLGMGGTEIGEKAELRPAFFTSLAQAYGPFALPGQGGGLIKDASGRVIGGIGVTGATSQQDAEAATFAITACGFTAEI